MTILVPANDFSNALTTLLLYYRFLQWNGILNIIHKYLPTASAVAAAARASFSAVYNKNYDLLHAIPKRFHKLCKYFYCEKKYNANKFTKTLPAQYIFRHSRLPSSPSAVADYRISIFLKFFLFHIVYRYAYISTNRAQAPSKGTDVII